MVTTQNVKTLSFKNIKYNSLGIHIFSILFCLCSLLKTILVVLLIKKTKWKMNDLSYPVQLWEKQAKSNSCKGSIL